MLIFPLFFSTESSETVSVVFVVYNDAGLACVVLVRWRASGLEEEEEKCILASEHVGNVFRRLLFSSGYCS